MISNRPSAREWVERIVLALLFTTIGSMIIIVFSPLRPLLDRGADYLGRIGLILLLLVAVSLVHKSTRFEKYSQVFLGLLIMAIAVSLDWVFGSYLMESLGLFDLYPSQRHPGGAPIPGIIPAQTATILWEIPLDAIDCLCVHAAA
jgi:hypothetical protein